MTKINLLLLVFLLTACRVQNQNIMDEDGKRATNLIPFVTAVTANKDHQILVAIIDTGVDYNHPKLKDQIHYTITDNRITGVGYDYLANDNWASPYLAQTAHLYATENNFEKETNINKNVSAFLLKNPSYARFLKDRAISEEKDAGIYHGTHVAGLASYDNPKIGILPYRVLPYNSYSRHDQLPVRSDFDILEEAIHRAVADGAKIINMSLGGTFTKKDRNYARMQQNVSEMQKVISKYPEVLFVVAAGNDGKWTDGVSNVNYPCGIKASNILCVGSLDKDNDLSTFTNIPINTNLLVFTLGEDLISTMPTRYCSVKFDSFEFESLTNYQGIKEEMDRECTLKKTEYAPLSGTSMATPLITHLAAEILIKTPTFDASELIAQIKKLSTVADLGGIKVNKIKIKKPSWYGEANLKSKREKSFEFIFR